MPMLPGKKVIWSDIFLIKYKATIILHWTPFCYEYPKSFFNIWEIGSGTSNDKNWTFTKKS